jgi:hypothetical protein
MGSTISILNDTEYTWVCRVGPDEKALRITAILSSVIIGIGATLATAGLAQPGLAIAVHSGVMSIGGFSTSALAANAALAANLQIVSNVATGVFVAGVSSRAIVDIGIQTNKHLIEEKGYHEILSGSTYETGKLSLSLMQQATCVRQEVLSPTVLKTKTLYMRRIFSGATHKSTKTYSIKEYLDGKGKLEETTIKLEPGANNTA